MENGEVAALREVKALVSYFVTLDSVFLLPWLYLSKLEDIEELELRIY